MVLTASYFSSICVVCAFLPHTNMWFGWWFIDRKRFFHRINHTNLMITAWFFVCRHEIRLAQKHTTHKYHEQFTAFLSSNYEKRSWLNESADRGNNKSATIQSIENRCGNFFHFINISVCCLWLPFVLINEHYFAEFGHFRVLFYHVHSGTSSSKATRRSFHSGRFPFSSYFDSVPFEY